MELDDLVATAILLLDRRSDAVTPEVLDEVVNRVSAMAPDIDPSAVRRRLEERVTIHVDRAVSLVSDHRPWLNERRASIEWNFWARYRHLLESVERLPPDVVRRIDEATDDILDLTEDPRRDGAWDRRGLVVGHVQSGKTANYLALIAKGIDTGFNVVIVLAGAHNDLRAQTQLRLDEGILGWDTHIRRQPPGGEGDEAGHRIGVGRLSTFDDLNIRSLTTSAEDGDFSRQASRVVERLGSDPVVLVIKKNKSVLENVDRWLTALNAVNAEDGRPVIPDHRLLLIDDEADHYSINTAKEDPLSEEVEPTTTNRLVRQILRRFEKSAYVGYTATAFANIFISETGYHDDVGEDLFPRSFIISLRAPSNYMGPSRVFGLRTPDDQEDIEPLPIVRDVDDQEDWLPSKHKNGHVPPPFVPESLSRAIQSFVLVCAARRARGQVRVHNSMLVHVTRFNSVQHEVSELVKAEFDGIRRRVLMGSGAAEDAVDALRRLWESDFVPTSREASELGSDGAEELAWEAVETELAEAVGRIEVRVVNGLARDALDYFDNRDRGMSVIAIGGDKLSRGLTLEGLSVSYYLRTSRAYDTLLQMGRWFGYRPGYKDLCRLFTTRQLRNWYADITLANAELLADFDRMVALGATPQEFGLRVRTHPDGLLVSNPSKVRQGERVRLSFSRQLSEAVVFDRAPAMRRANVEALSGLVEAMDDAVKVGSVSRNRETHQATILYREVPGDLISRFLEDAATSSEARRARTDLLGQYVDRQMENGELTEWIVALISSTAGDARPYELAGHSIGLITRSGNWSRNDGPDAILSDEHHFRIKRLISPTDELLGLTDEQRQDAEELAARRARDAGRKPPAVPSGPDIRGARDSRQGLLLIYLLDPSAKNLPEREDEPDVTLPYLGIAVSFPESTDPNAGVEYLVTEVFQRLELGW